MKALVYTALKTLEMREIAEPRPEAGEVLVRVTATGICGSDIHGFLGHSARRKPGLVLGHEAVGIVAALGDGVDSALLNTRVSINPLISCGHCAACSAGRQNVCAQWRLLGLDTTQGGFAEAVVVPARNVIPLPEHVTDAAAVMIEPLANAIHLLSHMPAEAGLFPTAVIFGGGTLGAAILAVARARGIRVLALSEPNPQRARVAEELGAEYVINPRDADVVAEIHRLTNGRGVDIALDAVGLEVTRQSAATVVARGGTVLLLGLDAGPTTFDFHDIIRREVRLQCSFAYTERAFAAAFEMVAQGVADFAPWTDMLPLSEGQRAFDRLVADPGDRFKIALQP